MPEQTTALDKPAPSAISEGDNGRRWWILAVLGIAQLMVVLDVTVVNIALPSAQKALGFSNDNRQWIITAYALAFGSLLLIGGRIGDMFGRRRTFIGGAIGFAVASAIGGAAPSFEVLVAARALQGAFAALLAPAALSLLTTTFTDLGERRRAFAVLGRDRGRLRRIRIVAWRPLDSVALLALDAIRELGVRRSCRAWRPRVAAIA